MKKLPLFALLAGCVVVPAKYPYETHDEAAGTRLTIVPKGISLLMPKDGKPRGAQQQTKQMWYAGVVDNGYVSSANTEVELWMEPDVTNLADQETELRVGCLKLEVMHREETSDGYGILYGCTNNDLHSFFKYIRVTNVNGLKVECTFGGTLSQAKTAQQVCDSIEAAAPAPSAPAQQAAR